MPLQVKPILPEFGAELSGVDIARPLAAADRAAIREAVDRYGVAVFRDTGLDDDSHVEFSRIFGHLETLPPPKGEPQRYKHLELFDGSNLTREGELLTDERKLLLKRGDRLWHTDSSFMPLRSAYSLLLAHEVPPVGGETWFADARGAYDDLSDAMKRRLDGLVAEHSIWWSRRAAGYPFSEEDVAAMPSARHPLVHPHRSGRMALYVASHARLIVGMDVEEGRALLAELIAHVTQPKYVFGVSWNVGDLVIWDNLCTLHRGGEYDDLNHRRDMRRTTVREAPAPQEKDNPFGESFQAAVDALQARRQAAAAAS